MFMLAHGALRKCILTDASGTVSFTRQNDDAAVSRYDTVFLHNSLLSSRFDRSVGVPLSAFFMSLSISVNATSGLGTFHKDVRFERSRDGRRDSLKVAIPWNTGSFVR